MILTQEHDCIQLVLQTQDVALQLESEVALRALAVTIVVDTCRDFKLALLATT
jgi:hypothetical protein